MRQIQKQRAPKRTGHAAPWTPPADPDEALNDDTEATLAAIDAALEAGPE